MGFYTLLGAFPTTRGLGNYFFTILLQFILVFPLLYRLHKYNPKLCLIFYFLVDLCFQFIAPFIEIYQTEFYLYQSCILRYFSAIGFGIWISDNPELFSKKNQFIFIGLIISILYIVANVFYGYIFPYFLQYMGVENIISFFYPLTLVLLGIKFFPSNENNKLVKLIAKIGRASYHIFLIQILYFSIYIIFFYYFFRIHFSATEGIFAMIIIISNIIACVIFQKIEPIIFEKIKRIIVYLFYKTRNKEIGTEVFNTLGENLD